ncbi:hypothetical protein L596_015065 [Steinernema carpocapsae]|uniref:RING-type domain-containing protein n=1 Tax=Steinernema carpocapsae TaxID=34508 RepID=A0A4U5NDS5_STECR|nr:hypothetical protein L596_015065 [Steinernema carpocapsae]
MAECFRKAKKRPMLDEDYPAVQMPPASGDLSRPSSSSKHYNCPICQKIFMQPYSTVCGHTFCSPCIMNLLHTGECPKCPICGTQLDKFNARIFPNHMVASMADEELQRTIAKRNRRIQDPANDFQKIHELCDDITQISELSSIQKVCDMVLNRRMELQMKSEHRKHLLMDDFLDQMIHNRQMNMETIKEELELLKADKLRIKSVMETDQQSRAVPDATASTSEVSMEVAGEGAMASFPAKVPNIDSEFEKFRGRMTRHFDGLSAAYFESRKKPSPTSIEENAVSQNRLVGSCAADIDEFSEVLRGMSQYGEIRKLAQLNYNCEATPVLSIVSSIEFDKDGEYFVVAGVTKKIKVYDYEAVVGNKTGIHHSKAELSCSSKISNVSWNPYTKSLLASSDYDGTVQLWDTNTTQKLRSFKEHEKRCWTVQFNNVDPHLMASGSDDSKVKLWSVSTDKSVGTIDARVNVCCVYFSPTSRNHLVFGCADHCVHLYDIRYPLRAVNVFRGHRKAVSYVKYCSENEVVSASTDSNLRVWDVNTGQCLRTMKGHTNEKNFVGLATDGNHIVCGSENNNLYLYYKGLSNPLMNYDFATSSEGSSEISEFAMTAPNNEITGGSDFVSAVCWKKNSNVVVAANSQGTTQILQLV